jgi:hypothetical protein
MHCNMIGERAETIPSRFIHCSETETTATLSSVGAAMPWNISPAIAFLDQLASPTDASSRRPNPPTKLNFHHEHF